MRVKLSNCHKDYLTKNVLNDRQLLYFDAKVTENNNSYYIDVTEQEADIIRDLCCDMLDVYGYNEDYELTSVGEILEDLINLFYVDNSPKNL